MIVTPLVWLYALSNFQLPIGTFNELLYGYMIQNKTSRHPAGAMVYGAVGGICFTEPSIFLMIKRLPITCTFLKEQYFSRRYLEN